MREAMILIGSGSSRYSKGAQVVFGGGLSRTSRDSGTVDWIRAAQLGSSVGDRFFQPVMAQAPLVLLAHNEVGVQRSLGITANPNIEGSWFRHPVFPCRAPVAQFVFAKRHVQRRLGMWLQRDALETS
jgi:hypothetical protein